MSFDSVKIGRNELCPCDSGKKYKKCCLINPEYEGNEEIPQDRVATLLGRKRLSEKLNLENVTLAPPMESLPKMSGAILELSKVMLDSARNKSERRVAITTACTAWNIAVIASDVNSLHEELHHFFEMCVPDKSQHDDFTHIILSMIAKKKTLFPDDHRLVVDFEIVDTRTYFSVNVAAMLPTEAG